MSGPTRRGVLAAAVTGAALPQAGAVLPQASPAHLPRWRGFNLLEKFTTADRGPFREQDFDIIAEWGFDFVRLPMHYRVWTPSPGRYDEQQLGFIDQAVQWGRARNIHVCLCLHTAPGYSVGGDNMQAEREAGLDLWADGPTGVAARQAFAEQWGMFAARYRGASAAALSFNLVNEPQEITGATYLRSVTPAVAAIRAQDPGRLIIADGTQGVDAGRRPVPELIPLALAQSTRGYRPFDLTHYRAPWAFGSDTWPEPRWPVPNVMNQFLFGAEKPAFRSPLVLDLDLAGPADLEITVALVSGAPHLAIAADGTRVLDRTFRPGPGPGDWKRVFARPEYGGGYQAVYDRAYGARLPQGARQIRIEVIDGDWLTFSRLRLRPAAGPEVVITPGLAAWPLPQQRFGVAADGRVTPQSGAPIYDREALWRDDIVPWQGLAASGVGVHVGEWGANRWTPRDVALAWMRDCLANWRRAGWGWALWNLRGEAGPLDSNRPDVTYENFKGHRLDRAMLDLLRAG